MHADERERFISETGGYDSLCQMQSRNRTQRINAEHRNTYLTAVANHHARVAQIAIEMLELCRPETWNTEMLEYMATKIDESHIKAFGTSLDPDC